MLYLRYFLAAVAVFLIVTLLYRLLSKGLSASARGQQLSRYAIGALIAVLPLAIAGEVVWNLNLALIAAVSALWMLTYPVLDFVVNRHRLSEIDNRMDFASGLYLFGFLTGAYLSLISLFPSWHVIVSTSLAAVELPVIILVIFQLAYFAVYHSSVDHDGLKLVLDTDANEVLEFLRSFSPWIMIPGLVGIILFIMAWFWWNLTDTLPVGDGLVWGRKLGLVVYTVGVGMLLFRGERSAFRRSGLPRLYYEDRAYDRECAGYTSACRTRLEALDATSPMFTADRKPAGRTYILVIGESASREYMEVFTPTEANAGTTPRLSAMVGEGSALIFPNAYSCHFQTVPTLTRALTEFSQYAPGNFRDAVSVVDLARKLGMKVYWFSNQGHIGANDTAVTLIAETADRAAWTSQSITSRNFDGELVKFLEEVDPEADKLIVFHLIGSHFTYSNRYPADAAYFKAEEGADGYVAAYRNSIRYTDRVLSEIYDYAERHLNLQFMVYCSDHADIPDRRRTPVFDDFGKLRIPLALVTTPAYRAEASGVLASLEANRRRPFSNDLLFNLLGGLWVVTSSHLPADLNLCSPDYRLTPKDTRLLLSTLTVDADPHFRAD